MSFALVPGARAAITAAVDGRWAVVTARAAVAGAPTSVHLVPRGGGSPVVLRAGSPGFVGAHAGLDGRIYLIHRLGEAGSSIVVVDPEPLLRAGTMPAGRASEEVLVGPGDAAIREVMTGAAAIVVVSDFGGVSTLTVVDHTPGRRSYDVALPGSGSVKDLRRDDRDGSRIWFHFTPVIPTSRRSIGGHSAPPGGQVQRRSSAHSLPKTATVWCWRQKRSSSGAPPPSSASVAETARSVPPRRAARRCVHANRACVDHGGPRTATHISSSATRSQSRSSSRQASAASSSRPIRSRSRLSGRGRDPYVSTSHLTGLVGISARCSAQPAHFHG